MTAEVYFAYGSNMHPRQMSRRCPSARLVGAGRLEGYELGFTRQSTTWGGGVADLVPCPRAHVWGVLYELEAEDLDSLDLDEGVPTAYERVHVDVLGAGQIVRRAWAYVVVNKSAHVTPTAAYMRVVVDGAREVALPSDYVAMLEAVATAT